MFNPRAKPLAEQSNLTFLQFRAAPAKKADPFADLGSLTGLKPKEAPKPAPSMGQMQMGSMNQQMNQSNNQSVRKQLPPHSFIF